MILKKYKLFFDEKALREWNALDNTIKEQFKKKLKKCLINPHIPKNKLSGFQNVYKIKLKKSGYRLAYKIETNKLIVIIIEKRDRKIYEKMFIRFKKKDK